MIVMGKYTMRKFELYKFLGFISHSIPFLVSLGYIWPTKNNELFAKDLFIQFLQLNFMEKEKR